MPHRGETEAQAETRRLAFEERRVQRVKDHIWELERDHLEIFRAVEQTILHVPFYGIKEEQDRFLNSISDTKLGQSMLRLQTKWNNDFRIPLILPKFSNFPNITIPEQQWLAMMGTWINVPHNIIGAIKKPDAFKRIEQAKTEIGTGFQRGQAYHAPVTEPAAVTITEPLLPEISFLPEVYAEPAPITSVLPAPTLSPQIKKIIDDWSVKKIIVPAWFANNNMNWVLEGRITEQEFLDAYTNLVNTGVITSTTPQVTIAPIPEITLPSIPEVSAVMELITTNFQVKLDNIIQFSSSLSNADYKRLQDEMSLEPKITLVFLNQTDFNPLSNFSKILRQIQNLLQGQVVETITISPTGEVITTLEPTVAPGKGLMGAGVLGLIGILMLGGFIADHVRRKR